MAFLDNRKVDANAPSYVHANLSLEAIANHAESANKAKYGSATEELGASILLVCSTEAVLHCEHEA